jgi:hypothetical protein
MRLTARLLRLSGEWHGEHTETGYGEEGSPVHGRRVEPHCAGGIVLQETGPCQPCRKPAQPAPTRATTRTAGAGACPRASHPSTPARPITTGARRRPFCSSHATRWRSSTRVRLCARVAVVATPCRWATPDSRREHLHPRRQEQRRDRRSPTAPCVLPDQRRDVLPRRVDLCGLRSRWLACGCPLCQCLIGPARASLRASPHTGARHGVALQPARRRCQRRRLS